jgi:hypothetical protein
MGNELDLETSGNGATDYIPLRESLDEKEAVLDAYS